MSSPLKNPVVVVPIPTLLIDNIPVSASQFLTLAWVPERIPWTTSLNWYVPIPLIVSGSDNVTVGADVYPEPELVTNIALTSLNPVESSMPIEVIPVAPVPPPPDIVTVGAVP